MIKQKEAVFAAFALGREQGLQDAQLINFAVEQVRSGIAGGDVGYEKDRSNEKQVASYSKALVSNWLKKDPRLNGGTKYVPATKRGPQIKDETLKALTENLKSLKAHNADMTIIQRVEKAVEDRRAQVAAAKSASKVQTMEETLASLEALGIELDTENAADEGEAS